ncbi:MAG: lamin tail domain-containing protein [Nannocystaceae bacterium]|nr:lamin tail domain-containing protein [Nannocystaceae bacterium]
MTRLHAVSPLLLAIATACGGDDGGTSAADTTAAASSSGTATSTDTTSATGTDSTSTGGSSSSGPGTTTDATGSSSGGSSTTAADSSSSGGSGSTSGGLESLVVINELSSANDGVLGADPIEVFNAGDFEVDLSGWIMTDDLTAPTDPYDPSLDDEEFVFPDGTLLDAGAYVVIVRGVVPSGHPFGLAGEGDTVSLIDPALTVMDFVAYGADEAAVSYCRMPDGPDGTWQPACTASFGESNG